MPLPLVIVDGAIAALGGGAVGMDGAVEMCFDGETPGRPRRRRPDHRLFGRSDDRVAPRSWKASAGGTASPTRKDSRAQLVIYAAGRDVVTGRAGPGRHRASPRRRPPTSGSRPR
ncbi:MAG: hypothetical protein MZU84_09105 [Sphingobacterium sp.]|nr:hypothetical protein [Sphingobacterium sp.]